MTAAARRRKRLPVPLSRVFPCWYLGGAAVTFGALALLLPDGTQAVGAIWGPVIGIEIRERLQTARRRIDEGLPVDRSSPRSDGWTEPFCALLFTLLAIGFGILISAVFSHVSPGITWFGAYLVVGTILAFLGLLLVLRARRRRRAAATDPADATATPPSGTVAAPPAED